MTHGQKRAPSGRWQLAVKNVLLLSVAGLLIGAIVMTSDNPVSRFVVSIAAGGGVTEIDTEWSGAEGGEGADVVSSDVTSADVLVPETSTSAESAGEWACFWDPTMNDNWHDDMLCTDGLTYDRPLLLEGQFVSRDDMESAGQRHAAELNGR